MEDKDVMKEIRFFIGSAYHEAVKTCLTVTEEELEADVSNVYVNRTISKLEDSAWEWVE